MIVYLAGPYETHGDVDENVRHARDVAARMWARGHAVICPHLNTHGMASMVPREAFLDGDRQLLGVCDAVVLLTDWEKSQGAREEEAHARALGIPTYTEHDLPQLHPTEEESPAQVARHREILGTLMRTHLDKHADYGANSVRGTGELGVVVRLWDKVCRLMRLYGINMRVEFQGLAAPLQPKGEAIDDTWLDLAEYAIIGQIVREGHWGE